ncbi:nucleotidyltransferase family protein [Hydrogenophaga defluvii]|uniref:NTP transferase domain-containing protein n=1 Tax=Hydrogenophaga defluvii TaxID=249410 RepID=A0ABW2S798_9BURK
MHDPVSPSATARVAALVLAAGAGSRMGHRPKCLLEIEGQALIRRQVHAVWQAGVVSVVVVLGHHADRIAPLLKDVPVQLVHHPAPDQGQVSSLHLGLRALTESADAVVVLLADQPLVNDQDIRDLLAAYATRPPGTAFVRPVVDGLPGNPVVFSSAVALALLAGGPDMGGAQWQAQHPSAVFRWATSNSHYRLDVDTMDDVAMLAARTGVRLVWPADLAKE